MKALFINCTLKKSPADSNTQALIDEAIVEFTTLGVVSETIRLVDYYIAYGTSTRNDDRDEWPQILQKIRECQILIIATPIWIGFPSSLVQVLIEKLDATFYEKELMDPITGQYILYNKVGGVVVTGNEDGAQASIGRIQQALNEYGCTIPPNASTYWVGKAGGSINYGQIAGRDEYTNKNTLFMVHNLYEMSHLLAKSPMTVNLNILSKKSQDETIDI